MARLNKQTIGWSKGLRLSGKTPEQEEAERVTRKDLKIELIKKAGGKCFLCGYDRSWAALQFHHREPGEKALGVSALLSRYYLAKDGDGKERSLALLDAEIKKCSLLCANCHLEVTHPDWENDRAAQDDRQMRSVRHLSFYQQWAAQQPKEIQAILKTLWRFARLHDISFRSAGMFSKLRTLRPDLARQFDERTRADIEEEKRRHASLRPETTTPAQP